MKGRIVAFVGIFCVAGLMISSVFAGKPEKTPKPGGPPPDTEWIAFSALPDLAPDLVGAQQVVGCCPNRGPAPPYTLTLPNGLGDPDDPLYCPPGTYTGHIFMNYWGAGRDQEYLVRFRGINEHLDYVSIEIIGGDIDRNNKTKVLTVTFADEECRVLEDDCPRAPCGDLIAHVNFTLVRYSL